MRSEQLSYPWAGATAITTSLIWGTTQVLIVVGFRAFTRSGAAPTTAGRVGTLLTAVGLIMAGTAALRSGAWSGWRRYTPLVLGVWMVAMMPLQFTPALPVAVGICAFAVMALGLALIVEGVGWEPRQ